MDEVELPRFDEPPPGCNVLALIVCTLISWAVIIGLALVLFTGL
jgi:hypothetical protein